MYYYVHNGIIVTKADTEYAENGV